MCEKKILYDLASRVNELAESDKNKCNRDLWRKHNSFKGNRPLLYLYTFGFQENFDESLLRCEDPLLRQIEIELHRTLMRSELDDDSVVEPWINARACYELNDNELWGVPFGLTDTPVPGGAAAYNPILLTEDFSCLKPAPYKIKERETALRQEKIEEALGGAMPVHMSRTSPFHTWSNAIAKDIAKMRGLEQIMWDMYDNEEWLHSLLTFMRDTILKNIEDAEAAGGYSLADQFNQVMPYSMELEDPNPLVKEVSMDRLWGFFAAEEYNNVSPEMFWEFLLQYQKPIIEKFGLVSYGCCEDLTRFIPYLRRINNLRRIRVSAWADAVKCAEQIGEDYILSWAVHPTMLTAGLDEDYARKYIREHFAIFKENHNHFDISVKGVYSLNHDPDSIKRWTKIVREETEKFFG